MNTWLWDTGSDVTCVSSRLPGVEKWKLTPHQSAPSTANGSPLQCLGKITTNIEIGHVSKSNIRLLVIKNLNVPAILGMDTLETFGSFGTDWTHKTLTLGDAKLVLEKCSHGSVLSPVVVSLISNHTIPLRSQCFVLAGTSDYSQCDQDALFSPFNDKLAGLDVLLGAGVISSGSQNRTPVTVLNNSEHPVELYAGTRVGEISPVNVQESKCNVNNVSDLPYQPPASPKIEPAAVTEKHQLKLLQEEYRGVFANNDAEVGRTHRTQFHIHTKTQVPVSVNSVEHPSLYGLKLINKSKICSDKALSSPLHHPTLHLPKADGSYLFCDVTLSEVFPLPSVRECLDSLHESKLFTTLDLYSGYWQILIAKGHRNKSAFSTKSGHWQFCVMPFGVRNAPAVFCTAYGRHYARIAVERYRRLSG